MQKPKVVLYIHHGSGEGGAANSLLGLLEALDRTRYTPVVACDFQRHKAREFFSKHGFECIDLNISPFVHTMKTWQLNTLRGLAKMGLWLLVGYPNTKTGIIKLIDSVRPDVVHLNGLSLLPFAPVTRSLKTPVVQHVRESVNEGCFGLRKRWLQYLAKRYPSHIIYICNDNQKRLTGKTSYTSIIYNPINFNKFKASNNKVVRSSLGIAASSVVLFFPGGSFFDIKGILPFLRALAIIRKEKPDLCAIVPGIDTPGHRRDHVRMEAERIIKTYGLDSAVIRLPFTEKVEQYYAACDIVVTPFVVPHFSRGVIEAGAMERPVVASRIGGITEVVDDGKTGMLVMPGDEHAIAESVLFLIRNPEYATAIAEAGYQKAKQSYDSVLYGQTVMKIYDKVLNPEIENVG